MCLHNVSHDQIQMLLMKICILRIIYFYNDMENMWRTLSEQCLSASGPRTFMFGTNLYNSLMFILIARAKKAFISTLFCWIYCFTNAWSNHMTQSWNWSWEDLVSDIFYWRSFFALFARLWVKIFKMSQKYSGSKKWSNVWSFCIHWFIAHHQKVTWLWHKYM